MMIRVHGSFALALGLAAVLPLVVAPVAVRAQSATTTVGADHTPARPDGPRGSGSPTLVVEPVAMAIAAFDTNGDGRVNRAELDAGVRHSFELIDTAHHGRLSYIEYSDWAERWLGDRNALPSPFEVDTDGDNAITLAELQARFAAIFARLDANKDGVLSRAELLTVRATPSSGFGDERRGRRGRRDRDGS